MINLFRRGGYDGNSSDSSKYAIPKTELKGELFNIQRNIEAKWQRLNKLIGRDASDEPVDQDSDNYENIAENLDFDQIDNNVTHALVNFKSPELEEIRLILGTLEDYYKDKLNVMRRYEPKFLVFRKAVPIIDDPEIETMMRDCITLQKKNNKMERISRRKDFSNISP